MNPIFTKQGKLNRSIQSVKLNPEDQKITLLKAINGSIESTREFSKSRPKDQSDVFEFQVENFTKNLSERQKQSGMKHNNESELINHYQHEKPKYMGFTSAREQMKNKLNPPCNPFQSLTESLNKRNAYQNSKDALQLSQARGKIQQLQKSVERLEKELAAVRNEKIKIENDHLQNSTRYFQELDRERKANKNLEAKHQQLLQNLSKLQTENSTLKAQISTLQTTISQISEVSPKSPAQDTSLKNAANDSQKFKTLGLQFSQKINELWQQNYKLKNKVAWLQGKLQQNQSVLSSLKSLNEMLEKRFNNDELQGSCVKDQLQRENLKLKEELLLLKEQNQIVRSECEVEVLRLENQLQEMKTELIGEIEGEREQDDQSNDLRNDLNGESLKNTKFKHRKLIKLQDQVESLQCGLKNQIEQNLRLKEKNTRLAKMVNLSSR